MYDDLTHHARVYRERFVTAEKLRDEDRQAIIEIARKSLASFQSKPWNATDPDLSTQVKT